MTDDDEIRAGWRRGRRVFASQLVRDSLPATFASMEAQYRQDRNPRHAWSAYDIARAASMPVPDWVLAYFDRVAETMHVLTINPPLEKDGIAKAAMRALELPRGGRRNAFLAWPKQNHEQWIALEVQGLLDEGHKLYEAARMVGKEHPTALCRQMFPQCRTPLSRATVETYYKRFAKKA